MSVADRRPRGLLHHRRRQPGRRGPAALTAPSLHAPGQATGRATGRAAAAVALAVTPLVYAPVTVELVPQKQLALALAALLAWRCATPLAAACLAAGLVALWRWPHGAAELLALSAAPVLVAALAASTRPRAGELAASGTVRDPDTGAACWPVVVGRRVAFAVAVLALAQAVGAPIYGGSAGAFGLPYRAATGPLGNPNFLATYVLLWLPLVVDPLRPPWSPWPPWPRRRDRSREPGDPGVTGQARRPTRRETAEIAIIAGALVAAAVASRSVLALAVLGAQIAVYAAAAARSLTRGRRRVASACAWALASAPAVAALAWAWPAIARGMAGRGYLARVYLSGMSALDWVVPRGPAPPGAFLRWQAEFLASHPEHAHRWTFPVFAHNDAIALLAHWGAVVPAAALAALAAWVVASRSSGRRAEPSPHGRADPPGLAPATWVAFGLAVAGFAAGSTVIAQPAPWATALLGVALAVRGRRADRAGSPPAGPASSGSRRPRGRAVWQAVALACALAWVAASATAAWAEHLRWRAVRAAERGAFAAAVADADRALSVSRTPEQLWFVRGQALLAGGRADDAARSLALAADALPHPAVLDSLGRAREAAGDHAGAREARDRLRRVRGHPGTADGL